MQIEKLEKLEKLLFEKYELNPNNIQWMSVKKLEIESLG
jgi:hypothetical protein